LAEKGCWEVAEARINNDRQLMEYLVSSHFHLFDNNCHSICTYPELNRCTPLETL